MAASAHAADVASTLADVRREMMRGGAGEAVVTTTCSVCGHPFTKVKRDDRSYCADCGELRQLSAGEQMSGHVGPVWEKAVRGQLAYWTAEARRLGLLPADASE